MSLLFHDPEDGPARPDPFLVLLWEMAVSAARSWRHWLPLAMLVGVVLFSGWLEGLWAATP